MVRFGVTSRCPHTLAGWGLSAVVWHTVKTASRNWVVVSCILPLSVVFERKRCKKSGSCAPNAICAVVETAGKVSSRGVIGAASALADSLEDSSVIVSAGAAAGASRTGRSDAVAFRRW